MEIDFEVDQVVNDSVLLAKKQTMKNKLFFQIQCCVVIELQRFWKEIWQKWISVS